MSKVISRRRFISISASAFGAGLVPGAVLAQSSSVRWQGVAMGARAELILAHPDRKEAEAASLLVQDEIHRLEKVFSLYDPGSALSRLNMSGNLENPPIDLIRCLDDAQQISQVTGGAFDITVQPLWNLYAHHFSVNPSNVDGPNDADIKTAMRLVDHQAVLLSSHSISFAKKGMAVTLNGIAQGYVTDRVAELLKARGFANLLINLGETRGIGKRQDGSDWQVGIKAPDGSGTLIRKLSLHNKAIATSGGYGFRFTADGIHHHLFNPMTGRSTNLWSSMSVIATRATQADALSTAFSSLPKFKVSQIAEDLKVSVIASDETGTVRINGKG